jgi:geranylgeranylglycerol-phosphate geranylgeranyltransferase
MQRIMPYIQISRPGNVFIAMASIVIAVSLSGRFSPILHVVLAILSTGLITIGANVINDYYDIETDKINRPDRPLPAGKIKPSQALHLFYIVYFLGFVLAFMITIPMFIIAVSVGILLYIYSYRLKKTVLWGNLAVSLATAMAFIFGGMAVNAVKTVIFPALFAFFFHFGREVIKDMQDMEGDKLTGANTLAVVHGYRSGYILSLIIFILLILLTIIPYILRIYGNVYLFIIIIGIYPVLGYIIIRLKNDLDNERLGKMSMLLKIDMLVGLLAIYFG